MMLEILDTEKTGGALSLHHQDKQESWCSCMEGHTAYRLQVEHMQVELRDL